MLHRTLATVVVFAAICTGTAHAQIQRPYAMGFADITYGPPAADPVNACDPNGGAADPWTHTWTCLRTKGDLAVIHEDGLVPWRHAVNNDPNSYPTWYKNQIAFRKTQRDLLPASHKVVLYVNITNSERTGIAEDRDDLPPDQHWQDILDRDDFFHPDVILGFVNHVRHLIDQYRPDFVSFGIEINQLYEHAFDDIDPNNDISWTSFKDAVPYVHVLLKYDCYWRFDNDQTCKQPQIFFSIQADTFYYADELEQAEFRDLMPFTDIVALSTYPFLAGLWNPAVNPDDSLAVPEGYLTGVREKLRTDKPLAIAETGWTAQNMLDVEGDAVPADVWTQTIWAGRVLQEAFMEGAVFVNWFVPRDYDRLYDWNPNLVTPYWRDTGLLDEDGLPRPAMSVWDSYRSLPRSW
jgi:hypothetical protein